MRKILGFTFIILSALALVACGGGKDKPKSIKSIEVTKMPTKDVYFIGEVFSPNGGELTVTYEDGTTKTMELTAEGVTLTAVNTTRPGKKTVNVTYEGKRAVFSVTVKEEEVSVVYNYGYVGSTPLTVKVVKGSKLEEPTNPTREGYTFERWYTDENLTIPFNFDTVITSDIQLYANWRDDSVNYYNVTFDPGYYGAKVADKVVLEVQENSTVSRPTNILTRVGYEFKGWYASEDGTTAYNFESPITTDTTIYAHWTKVATGVNEYKFEAEDVDLTGKTGPGFSGTGQESGMIQKSGDVKYVSFLYQQGISLDFYIASDSDVSNVKFSISLAAEFKSLTINPALYAISVNGVTINYEEIQLVIPNGQEGAGVVSPFTEFTLSTNVTLKKGENHIKLLTNNNINYVGSGTIAATAPVVDYIKFTTDAVLIWDGSKGLPMEYDV